MCVRFHASTPISMKRSRNFFAHGHFSKHKYKKNTKIMCALTLKLMILFHLLLLLSAAATRRCSGQNVFCTLPSFLFSFCLRRGPLISFSYSLLLPSSNRAMNFTTTWAPCFSTSSPPPLLYLILSLVYALSSSEIQTRHVINNCCYVWLKLFFLLSNSLFFSAAIQQPREY